MKNFLIMLSLLLAIPCYSIADSFLGAPIIPGGKTTGKTDERMELKIDLTHDEVLDFYRKALKDHKDIKYREWTDSTYIEDDGNLTWHSITISKGNTKETSVTIVKDNWTWIIGTLVLRYIGVFVVLLILFIAMSISGKIISASVKKIEGKKTAG